MWFERTVVNPYSFPAGMWGQTAWWIFTLVHLVLWVAGAGLAVAGLIPVLNGDILDKVVGLKFLAIVSMICLGIAILGLLLSAAIFWTMRNASKEDYNNTKRAPLHALIATLFNYALVVLFLVFGLESHDAEDEIKEGAPMQVLFAIVLVSAAKMLVFNNSVAIANDNGLVGTHAKLVTDLARNTLLSTALIFQFVTWVMMENDEFKCSAVSSSEVSSGEVHACTPLQKQAAAATWISSLICVVFYYLVMLGYTAEDIKKYPALRTLVNWPMLVSIFTSLYVFATLATAPEATGNKSVQTMFGAAGFVLQAIAFVVTLAVVAEDKNDDTKDGDGAKSGLLSAP